MDARRYPRFKLELAMRIYPRDCPVVRGDTVDISESGIAAMLRLEVPVGEVVRLEFKLPLGEIEVLALVRRRIAFRWLPIRGNHFFERHHWTHLSPVGGATARGGCPASRRYITCCRNKSTRPPRETSPP